MDRWAIGISCAAMLISGLSVYWTRRADAINREVQRLRDRQT